MYKKIEPAAGSRHAPASRHIGFYRIRYGNGFQILVRIPRGTMEATGWQVGDQIDVEFDAHKKRLRLTNSPHGAFRLGSKDARGQEGRVRWTRQPGRPDLRKSFRTDRWTYRHTDNALVINVDAMEVAP